MAAGVGGEDALKVRKKSIADSVKKTVFLKLYQWTVGPESEQKLKNKPGQNQKIKAVRAASTEHKLEVTISGHSRLHSDLLFPLDQLLVERARAPTHHPAKATSSPGSAGSRRAASVTPLVAASVFLASSKEIVRRVRSGWTKLRRCVFSWIRRCVLVCQSSCRPAMLCLSLSSNPPTLNGFETGNNSEGNCVTRFIAELMNLGTVRWTYFVFFHFRELSLQGLGH